MATNRFRPEGYDYVRKYYGVDPRPGSRVRHTETNQFGVIARLRPRDAAHHVQVVFDGHKHSSPCHPTSLDYEPDLGADASTEGEVE